MKLKIIPWSVGLVFALAGCANLGEPGAPQAWQLQPQLEIRQGETVPQALYRLGRYHQGQLNYDRAIAAYRDALALDPAFVDARNGLGVIYSAQGRYDNAIRELGAAIAIAPHLGYLHNNLGYAYLLRGSNEQAIRSLEEAIRLEPGQARTLQNLQLARSRMANGQPAAAAAIVSSEPAVKPAKDSIAPLRSEQSQRRASVRAIAPSIFQLQLPAVPAAVPLPPAPTPPAGTTVQSVPRPAPVAAAAQTVVPGADPLLASAPRSFRLEVSNGNGVNRLARRVAQHLKDEGMPAARLTNQRLFNQPASEIQYRRGYAAEANALRSKLHEGVPAVESRRLAGHIDVRLVLGRDSRTETALFLREDAPVQVGLLGR